jgi:hypothetical protein
MKFYACAIILIMFLILASCSNSGSVTPDFNADSNQKKIETTGSSPVFISDYDIDGNPLGGQGILGVFHGFIDLKNVTGELVSTRSSSLTDTLEVVDVTNFMSMAPCHDCVKLKSISINPDGRAVASIGIKHPYGVGDPFKPITGRNRGDLHVFNVEGIVVVETGDFINFPQNDISISDFGLYNPDGYTGYLDEYLDGILDTSADIHPYILHFDDYSIGSFDASYSTGFESITYPLPSGNLVMPMGSDYDYKDYIFDIPDDDSFEFIFAVGCTYPVAAANKLQRFDPEYRIPQHNKKAASEVFVDITSNDLKPGDTSSTAELTVQILDINNGVAVGTNLNEMFADSSVGNIEVEVPGITSSIQNDYTFVSGDGRDPLNPLTYTVIVTNTSGGSGGDYKGLIKVTDTYTPGLNTSPLLNGKDGIHRVDPLVNPLAGLYNLDEFATYATFDISISSSPEDPIAIIHTTPEPANVGSTNPIVLFDGSESYDPDGGSITLFEWDFDWDGDPLNFVPDVSSPDPYTEHNYICVVATYTAGLRVTDDDSPARVSAIASAEIDVYDDFVPGDWEGPVSFAGEMIQGDFLYVTGQSIQVDSTGLAHIITYDNANIYHRTFDGTTMSPRETATGVSGGVNMVTSAIDNNDVLHIVWFSGYNPKTLKYTTYESGAFTGIVTDMYTESRVGYNMEMMNIQRNFNGDIMITFLDYDADKASVFFMYSLNTGSGFSAVENIPHQIHIRSGTGPNPSYTNVAPNLIATPNGYFHQIYYAKEADLVYNVITWDMVYDGSSWASPRVAYDYPYSGQTIYDIFACPAPDGDILIGGQHEADQNMHYIRYEAATDTWHDAIKVAEDCHIGFSFGAIEVDTAGMVHYCYTDNTGLISMKVFCKACSPSVILGTPSTVIDSTTVNHEQNHIDLMWDHDGNLLADYQDTRNSPINTYFNRLEY